MFDYFTNTLLSTAIEIQRTFQLLWSAYIEARINIET